MKNFKLNLNKSIALRGVSLLLAGSLMSCSLAGCSKKVDCDIDIKHAHAYLSSEGFIKYLEKENETYYGYTRTDDYIDDYDANLLKFLNKNDLLKIDDNKDIIDNIMSTQDDYIEYRYRYNYMMPIPHTISNGKTTTTYFTYMPMVGYSWTSNKNHGRLTGEQRRCHYTYIAYKVEKDAKGKYVLIPSEYVDSLDELDGKYPYIKEKFYKVVDTEHGYDLDYEDGPEEDYIEAEEQSYNITQQDEKAKTLVKR